MSGTNPNESSVGTRLHGYFGENNLVEPKGQLVRTVWKEISDSLCEQFQPGVYQDREMINKVLHSAYILVEKRLDRLIRRLASREFMEFLLYQYDLAAELWQSVPDSGNLDDLHRESHLASRRRALKHLAEQTAMCSPPEYAPLHLSNLITETEEAVLNADILVTLYMMSDRTHFLFPNHSQLTLSKNYELVPIRLDPISWSARMALESLNWLITGACFKKLPAEWTTPETTASLDRLSKAASDWFESQTIDCLSNVGIKGSTRKRRLQGHGESIDIPSEVGEIDFLGYSIRDDLLVVAECKMVENRMEAKFWKEEIAEFVEGKKSYAEKFRKKFHWVLQNRAALSRVLFGHEKARRIAVAMLTLYPSFTAIRIKDFPCVSLAEFMADYNAAQAWPYQTGVFDGA